MTTPSLPVIRELVRCYQAFDAVAGAHIRSMGLTAPQFDIIATLGNTPGMRFKELGEKTLCTKGTLSGIVDRLAEKGLVRRVASPTDGRSQIVQLTAAGEKVFAQTFPAQIRYMDELLAGVDAERMSRLQQELHYLRGILEEKGKP
ncbi:MAG: MarR family transcriptional regulator [Rhodocyclaceae bacterium]|nr:MarR family transcriptional regulator [Rhodocyclaceae bacterium]